MRNSSSLPFLSFIPGFSVFILPGLFHRTPAKKVVNAPPCLCQAPRAGQRDWEDWKLLLLVPRQGGFQEKKGPPGLWVDHRSLMPCSLMLTEPCSAAASSWS